MQEENNTATGSALLISVLLSVLVHVLIVLLWVCLPTPERPTPQQRNKQAGSAIVKIKRNKTAKNIEKEPDTPPETKPFAKTDPDRPQQAPTQADFEGQRDARAEGENNKSRKSDAPIPTMEGEEKTEINTLTQERQDGDVEFYGKREQRPENAGDNVRNETEPLATQAPADGLPQTSTETQADTGTEPQGSEDASASVAPAPRQPDGDLKVQHEPPPRQEDAQAAAPAPGLPNEVGKTPLPARPRNKRGPVYDPSQAPHAQPPGLRTTERRSRSTGQFVIGRKPSLNVEASPRGRYEELVYRLIARQWYFACDTHCGDIIPGSIILAIRLNKRGQIISMNLMSRRGAGALQQSFTFAAIRKAQIPPMPPEVQKTLNGDQMEIVITFNFD